VIVGGVGNNIGIALGALIVPVLFTQLPKFLPDIPGHPGLILNIAAMAIGVLLMLVLWFRPQGIIPERRRMSRLPEISLDPTDSPSRLMAELTTEETL
jgi:branched-chain amino acid transport system permease protein